MVANRTLFGRFVRWVGMILIVGLGWFVYQEKESLVRFLRPRAEEKVAASPVATLDKDDKTR